MTTLEIFLSLIVAVNTGSIFFLWNRYFLRHKQRLNVLSASLKSAPIIAKHEKTVVPAVGPSDDDIRLISDFSAFPAIVNWYLEEKESCWRLARMANTELRNKNVFDFPVYGIECNVYYNNIRAGALDISSNLLYENSGVIDVDIEIDSVRLFSFENLLDFLEDVQIHVQSNFQSNGDDKTIEVELNRIKNNESINKALVKSIWDDDNPFDGGPSLKVSLEGNAFFYMIRDKSVTWKQRNKVSQNLTPSS